jgi:hypothetical protein
MRGNVCSRCYGNYLIAKNQTHAEYGCNVKRIILAVLTLVTGCTTGTHKATGMIGPAISPNQVVVYYSTPAHSKTIGQVSAQSFGGLTYKDASADALEEIRLQAGTLGANGVLIQDRDTAPLCGAQFRGMAILVSP